VLTANDMPATVRQRIDAIVQAIVAATGLRGLCGLDFLADGEQAWVLELNARPTASVALYFDRDLLARHLDACTGRLPAAEALRTADAVGESVLYAAAPLVIPADFPWPSWCRDVPLGATQPGLDEPICSIHATGETPAEVRATLAGNLVKLSTELTENCSDESQAPERQCAHRTASPLSAH
jgi:predicted ATP-grasp superfamily ATP-dependent carboligase